MSDDSWTRFVSGEVTLSRGLVAGSRAINAEPPERRYERVSTGTELGGPAGRCWLPTFEDDLIGAGIGIEPNSDETTQSMTGFSRANASSARR